MTRPQMPALEPWGLWILHKGKALGRARSGWRTCIQARVWADRRLTGADVRIEHRDTGERWDRLGGQWLKIEQAARPEVEPRHATI